MATPIVKMIPVDCITMDGGTQVRTKTSEAIVEEYAEALRQDQEQANWPPIVVYTEAHYYWLADGFHRVWAAKKANIPTILAEIRKGSRVDALRYALGANGTHGLRRTPEDVTRAIRLAYENRKELGLPDVPAARLIADLVRVSPTTAGEHLSRLDTWKAATARTGADGKTYPVPPPKPPPPPPPPPATQPPPPATNQVSRLDTWKDDTDPGEPQDDKPAKVVIRDKIGRAIPPEAREIWNRRQEAQDLLTAMSRVRSIVRHAQDDKDPLFAELNFSSAMAHLDQAYAAVEVALPHTVCPSCQGLLGCKLCCGRRMISKFRWDTACTDQQRELALKSTVEE